MSQVRISNELYAFDAKSVFVARDALALMQTKMKRNSANKSSEMAVSGVNKRCARIYIDRMPEKSTIEIGKSADFMAYKCLHQRDSTLCVRVCVCAYVYY